jgi:hypothetical protein
MVNFHTDVIFNDIDLPRCCGLCVFGTPCMSSLNDTDFSNDTDLSENKENKNKNTKNYGEKFRFHFSFSIKSQKNILKQEITNKTLKQYQDKIQFPQIYRLNLFLGKFFQFFFKFYKNLCEGKGVQNRIFFWNLNRGALCKF